MEIVYFLYAPCNLLLLEWTPNALTHYIALFGQTQPANFQNDFPTFPHETKKDF